jgi:maltose/moltooligosaccharide transporter
MVEKPRLSTAQIVSMSLGFFGIQFGWNLQLSNMSAIYEYLGANADQLPILWLAAPLTGLIVQPVIGHMSDRTWGRLGRRRPYFLTGAILSSLALVAMPNSATLWMAAGLLWILDASINVSMEPFRAFVADLLPEEQRARGFAMQSLFIGLGASLASALPWMLTHVFHAGGETANGHSIPWPVRLAFYIGAPVFLSAVLWTVFTTKEYPPEDLKEFQRIKETSAGVVENIREIFEAIRGMPETMRRLSLVQISTWLGLFCMWLYFPPAVARHVFGAPNTNSPLYTEGVEWGGNCFAIYSIVCFLFSFALAPLAQRLGKKVVHSFCLLCGACGLFSVALIHDKWFLWLSMIGVGIAWASVLAMPYTILAGSLPKNKMGTYMGVFNFSIVLPEIVASLCFGWVMNHLLAGNRLYAVVAGGGFLVIAALLMLRVSERAAPRVAGLDSTGLKKPRHQPQTA